MPRRGCAGESGAISPWRHGHWRAAIRRIDPSRLDPGTGAALFAALFALATVPVLLCNILPLVDYPNHLARVGLLARLPSDATLRQFYETAWHPIPNLAMDAIVPPLLNFM